MSLNRVNNFKRPPTFGLTSQLLAIVKPDFDRFSCGPLSGRADLDEFCGNSGAMSSKNNLSNFCCDPKNDSLDNYAVCYTTGSTVDHDLYAWRSSHI